VDEVGSKRQRLLSVRKVSGSTLHTIHQSGGCDTPVCKVDTSRCRTTQTPKQVSSALFSTSNAARVPISVTTRRASVNRGHTASRMMSFDFPGKEKVDKRKEGGDEERAR
jgi:hypothetical protein